MAESHRWSDIMAFLSQRRPDLYSRFRGATQEQLRALFGHSPGPVPQAVLDIHASLGEDDAGYFPLGRLFTLSAQAQLEDMDESVVAGRFLRFAIADEPTEEDEPGLYVDLASNDGYDAPVLRVCEPWDRREPHPGCHTVMSKAIQRAHEFIELEPRAELGYLMQPIQPERLGAYIEAFDRLAARIGLQETLIYGPELRCGVLDGAALMFDVLGPSIPLGTDPKTGRPPSHRSVWVWIAGDALDVFRNLTEQITDHMPPLQHARRRSADD